MATIALWLLILPTDLSDFHHQLWVIITGTKQQLKIQSIVEGKTILNSTT